MNPCLWKQMQGLANEAEHSGLLYIFNYSDEKMSLGLESIFNTSR